MEALVIPLPVKKKEPKVDLGPQFYCMRCNGGEFVLYASGVVHCKDCGSMMRNLFVTQCPEAS